MKLQVRTQQHTCQDKLVVFLKCHLLLDLVEDTTAEGYGPVYLSVSVTPSKRVLDTGNHPSMIQNRLKPTSELLKSKNGDLTHKVEVDGEAKICVRASGASNQNYMRFGLQIDIEDSTKYNDINESSADEEALDGHLSHMEMEMLPPRPIE